MLINIYIDAKANSYKKKIKFAINYIFSTLGYEYRIAESYAEIDESSIVFLYTKFVPDLEEIQRDVPFNIVFVVPIENFLYFVDDLKKLEKNNTLIKYKSDFNIYTEKEFKNPIYRNSGEKYIGFFEFDFFANIFFWISNLKDNLIIARDKYQRIPDIHSSKNENIYSPNINIMLDFFDNFLKDSIIEMNQALFRKTYWPRAQKKCSLFSFEIDSLQKWTFTSFIIDFLRDCLGFFKIKVFFSNIYKKIHFLFTNNEPYWNFKEIITNLEKYGMKGTFFFGNNIKGKQCSLDYYLKDKDIARIIDFLNNKNHEVAYLATNNSDSISYLKKSLEEKKKIYSENVGIKNKNLAFNLKKHPQNYSDLSILYNHNWSFNQNTGFKHGIGFPFKNFDFQDEEAYNYLNIPLIFNSNNLLRKRKVIFSYADVQKKIKLINKELEKFNGIMSYSFSISSFEDIHYISKLYKYCLDIEDSDDYYITTAKKLSNWWKKREKVKFSYDYKNKLIIDFTEDIASFSLEIIGKLDINIINKSVKYERRENYLIFKNIKKSSKIAIIIIRGNSIEKDNDNN